MYLHKTELPKDIKNLLKKLVQEKAEAVRENLLLKNKLATLHTLSCSN